MARCRVSSYFRFVPVLLKRPARISSARVPVQRLLSVPFDFFAPCCHYSFIQSYSDSYSYFACLKINAPCGTILRSFISPARKKRTCQTPVDGRTPPGFPHSSQRLPHRYRAPPAGSVRHEGDLPASGPGPGNRPPTDVTAPVALDGGSQVVNKTNTGPPLPSVVALSSDCSLSLTFTLGCFAVAADFSSIRPNSRDPIPHCPEPCHHSSSPSRR